MVTVVQCSWNQYITHRTYTEHFGNGHWCTGINLIQYANILSEYCVDICAKVCKEWKTHRSALINKFKSDLEHFDVANVNELRVNAYSIGIMAKKITIEISTDEAMAASMFAPPEAMPNRQFACLLIESSFTHLWLFIQFFFPHFLFFPTENWILATWWFSFIFFSFVFCYHSFVPTKINPIFYSSFVCIYLILIYINK